MIYVNFTNVDARFSRPYEPGDRLVRGWTGTVEDPIPKDDGSAVVMPDLVLEVIFARHNADDRPDGRLCPSMSVGDVVILGESAFSVDSLGFVPVDLDAADLITDRTWTEVIQ